MNAKIDIKTPAGQSLEGFPQEIENFKGSSYVASMLDITDISLATLKFNPSIHKGDTITIEIL